MKKRIITLEIPPHLDPYHLASLSEDIDRECERLVRREFPDVVDDRKLGALKVKLRDNLTSLLTEMLSEWRHLATEIGEDLILERNWVIPNVEDLARLLPYVHGPEPEEERKQWHVERVRWTISAWLQLWSQLFAYLPKADHAGSETALIPPMDPSLITVTMPSHINAVLRIWHMIRILTLEYLESKSQLLIFLDKNDLRVEVQEQTPDLLAQARHAFWYAQSDASLLLMRALRHELFQGLGLKPKMQALCLYPPTVALVLMAADAGVPLPHSPEVLANILVDLENQAVRDEPIKLSYLYPVFRILTDTVMNLQKAPPTPEARERVGQMLDEISRQRLVHANNSKS